jgi:hypothetical protein
MLFSILRASLQESYGDDDFYFSEDDGSKPPLENILSTASLSFKVKLNRNMDISLSSGERLEDIRGHLFVQPEVGCLPDVVPGIGGMSFSKAISGEYTDPSITASYSIEVKVPPVQFIRLVDAARNGRLPESIFVMVRGMELPNIGGERWDIESSPQLHVVSISFNIPLASGETILEKDNLLASTQLQVFNLSQGVSTLVTTMQGINTKLKWMMGLITVLAVVTIFKN